METYEETKEPKVVHIELLKQAIEKITGEDAEKCMLSIPQVKELFLLDPKGAELFHRILDINKDGKVEFEEIKQTITTLTSGTNEEKAEIIFKTWDENGDGYLTEMEVRQMMFSSVTLASSFLITKMLGPMSNLIQTLDSENHQNEPNFKDQIEQGIQEQINGTDIDNIVQMLFQQTQTEMTDAISLEKFKQHCSTPDSAATPIIEGLISIAQPLIQDENDPNCQMM
ncbi:calcium binding protein [Anaeramoeba ignava]|uniref:Calcium binding protein n=1 Tax=Anaeramoeba ignava TaxID=1746090 RepID=A0A9Q0L9C4_ANAIG|nr:calcium binding protein [Anaeramoeba ignava]|eukprot:Anaeramoba_ignava/a218055_204.p1 GENE.a218055_204~~a218055_204.p1  ORF type:complete len:227 (-),score=88.04 a218055_204:118-798(-)